MRKRSDKPDFEKSAGMGLSFLLTVRPPTVETSGRVSWPTLPLSSSSASSEKMNRGPPLRASCALLARRGKEIAGMRRRPVSGPEGSMLSNLGRQIHGKAREIPSQGWKTFLRNHADGIASIDLFVVPTLSFRLLYGLVILQHGRRQILWSGVTAHPTAEGIARQLTEACSWKRQSLPFRTQLGLRLFALGLNRPSVSVAYKSQPFEIGAANG
jgi:hypothetical protein